MKYALLGSVLLPLTALSSCLPADTRPEPGRVEAEIRLPADLAAQALTWSPAAGTTVQIEELMVSIGNLELQGDDCSSYSEARYRRILDLLQPGGQKLAEVFGLGDCQVGYSVRIPDDDAVLGKGVTESDRNLMERGIVAVSSSDGVSQSEGMVLHLKGSLTQGSTRARFDWGIAESQDFGDCQRSVDGKVEEFLPLEGGETLNLAIEIDPRNLFKLDEQSLVEAILDADRIGGNDNGVISVEELVAATKAGMMLSLGELLRTKTFPTIFRYDGDGSCALTDREGHGPGGHF